MRREFATSNCSLRFVQDDLWETLPLCELVFQLIGPMKKIISTNDAPAAVGPYSQAVRVGSMRFLRRPNSAGSENGQIVSGDIGEQTRRVLDNITAVLQSRRI